VNCLEEPIGVEVIQQGEKLSLYRKDPVTFQEAIPVIVMRDGNKTIHQNIAPCEPIFDFAMITATDEKSILNKGKRYTILVQIEWNCPPEDLEHRSFMLKVSAPCKFKLNEKGFKV